MSEYAESIQDLVKRAFCDIAYSELDTLRCQYFIHGLRKEIAIQVRSLDPATFEQAYSIARRHETTLKLLQNSASAYVPNKACHFNSAASSNVQSQETFYPHHVRSTSVFSQPSGPQTNQEQLPVQDLPSEGYVSLAEFNSLKNDIQDLAHEVRSLRLNNSTRSSARPPQNRALNYRSNVICHFCHRPGHIQRQCREYLQLQNQMYNTSYPSVPPRVAPPNYQSLPYASKQPRSEDQYIDKTINPYPVEVKLTL